MLSRACLSKLRVQAPVSALRLNFAKTGPTTRLCSLPTQFSSQPLRKTYLNETRFCYFSTSATLSSETCEIEASNIKLIPEKYHQVLEYNLPLHEHNIPAPAWKIGLRLFRQEKIIDIYIDKFSAYEAENDGAVLPEDIRAEILGEFTSELSTKSSIELSIHQRQINEAVEVVRRILESRLSIQGHMTCVAEAEREIQTLKKLLTSCTEAEKEENEMMIEEWVAVAEEAREGITESQEVALRSENDLLHHILPKDQDDSRNAILEVRPGVGGEEAMLFAKEIFHMYESLASDMGWSFKVIDRTVADLGGYKEASASITGSNVFGYMKFETGVHRVQRIPVNEKPAKIQTSAMTVAILPEAEEVDVDLKLSDVRIDFYRSSGKGGQHVNTTDSAVRLTHMPSGLVVCIQDERSQIQNKAKAFQILRSRLYEAERLRLHQERSSMRASQVGSGDRSARIRTYNFPQGRVTDHRINTTMHGIEPFMSGELLLDMIEKLRHQERLDIMAQVLEEEK